MTLSKNISSLLSTRLFSFKELLVFSASFMVIVIGAAVIIQLICRYIVTFNCSYYWPMNVFIFAPVTPQHILTAICVAALFAVLVKYLSGVDCKFSHLVLAGIVLVIGSTLIQGWQHGLYTPISGHSPGSIVIVHEIIPVSDDGQQYHHDAIKIRDPFSFLRNFNQLQSTYDQPQRAFQSLHTYTHPPGAILIFYALAKLLRHPGLIAVFIAAVSILLSAFFFYKLLLTEVEMSTARYATFLFMLLPAVQIYYLATLDALIAGLLIGALYFFKHPNAKHLLSSLACLTLASLLTFGSGVILPVLVGYELIRRRSLKRSAFIIGGLGGIFVAIYALFGYNQVQAFRVASAHENIGGFMLFAAPANYFFTRLQNIGEIFLFLGPFLFVLLLRSVRATEAKTSDLFLLSLLAGGSLLAFFMTGALKIGETARACIFIYPYILFPIGIYLQSLKPTLAEKIQLASLVFAQTVAMQLFGFYFW